IPMGTLMALPPSVSQLDGSGRRADVGPLFRQSLWLAAMLGVLLFVFLSLAVLALAPMGIAVEIRPGAADFLRGIRWGVPALTLVLGLVGLLVLLPLGWVLTFGEFGLPELGAGGLGIASAVMLWLQALAFALYLARSKRFAALAPFARFDPPRWAPIRNLAAT